MGQTHTIDRIERDDLGNSLFCMIDIMWGWFHWFSEQNKWGLGDSIQWVSPDEMEIHTYLSAQFCIEK